MTARDARSPTASFVRSTRHAIAGLSINELRQVSIAKPVRRSLHRQ